MSRTNPFTSPLTHEEKPRLIFIIGTPLVCVILVSLAGYFALLGVVGTIINVTISNAREIAIPAAIIADLSTYFATAGCLFVAAIYLTCKCYFRMSLSLLFAVLLVYIQPLS
ncbi:MAG: hypothetical protein AAF664_10235 [Planctomycetota bacterium]